MKPVESHTDKKAKQLHEFNAKLYIPPKDFDQFANSIQTEFKPNIALQRALDIA